MATMAFVPLSPAHSDIGMFQPLSPAHSQCVYEPESPRVVMKEPSKSASLMEKLIYNIKNPSPCKIKPTPYKSIHDWRTYCRHMMMNEKKRYSEATRFHLKCPTEESKKHLEFCQIQMKKTQERLVEIRFMEIHIRNRKAIIKDCINAWKESCPTPRKIKEPIDVPHDPYHVITRLTVKENGTVGVTIKAPLAPIYDKYFKNFKMPPHEEYVEALREFGYPEWVLERMDKRWQKKGETNEPTRTIQESLEHHNTQIKKVKTKTKSILNKFKSSRPSELPDE